jgi:hypothetical protein
VVAREEFLRWVEAEGFIPRPTFWDGPKAAAVVLAFPKNAAAPQPAASPLHARIRELLDQGHEPGGNACSWAQFQRMVEQKVGKGTSLRNLKRVAKEVRAQR